MISNAKLALFYDWLFFEIHKDNIMNIGIPKIAYLSYTCNIEPAMLLMFHSIPKYPALTASLLDFLVGCMDFYDPTRKDYVKQGILNSLKVIISKGVIGYFFKRPRDHLDHCNPFYFAKPSIRSL